MGDPLPFEPVVRPVEAAEEVPPHADTAKATVEMRGTSLRMGIGEPFILLKVCGHSLLGSHGVSAGWPGPVQQAAGFQSRPEEGGPDQQGHGGFGGGSPSASRQRCPGRGGEGCDRSD